MIMLAVEAVTLGQEELYNLYQNSATKLLEQDGNLKIGGYGEVHYNQQLQKETYNPGNLDVHRFVLLTGYSFSDRMQLITEIEFEHVKEVYIEQAFLQYKLKPSLNLRAGLVLIPAGIINLYHEPTAFHGVERPVIDQYIVPSTWREIGAGVAGRILPLKITYEFYVTNGLKSWDNGPALNGAKGLRGGRQKGAESFITSPDLSGRIEYFGIRGLNAGLSFYTGPSQSNAYKGLSKDDQAAVVSADSTVVGVTLAGADIRYQRSVWKLNGQLYYTSLSNTQAYNIFSGDDNGPNDLGRSMTGYYAEISYNLFRAAGIRDMQLFPFVRYEWIDTHNTVDNDIQRNDNYRKEIITAGISFYPAQNTVVKADMQWMNPQGDAASTTWLNLGIGFMF
ncbi:MAG: FlxA-like family protein [Bacteroidales bacterium]